MRRTAFKSGPSKAKRDFDAEYAAVLPSVLARGCEFMTYVWIDVTAFDGMRPSDLPKERCLGREVGHHARGRDLKHPEISNAPENLRCLCDYHHRYVHAHPEVSRRIGLMLSRIS